MIRSTISSDSEALLKIIADSNQFDTDGLAYVKATLDSYLEGNNDELWLTADDGEPIGVAYCAPEPVTSGTWNLLMLWVRKDRHGRGHGSALVGRVESALIERGARLLIVETSSLDEFAAARAFYNKCGFRQEARIKNFFAAGDDKIISTKPVSSKSPEK